MGKNEDSGLLQAALLGYQQQQMEIEQKIAELKRRLGHRGTTPTANLATPTPQKPHRISPEGLKRIRDAQKRRWAKAKAAQAQES